jgi:hypothetical protein
MRYQYQLISIHEGFVMRDQMIALMKLLQTGGGISLEEFREITYKEREFLFNEIQYWCLYEKDDPSSFAARKIPTNK